MGHHPDRNAQFANIARLRHEYEVAGDAVISIDTKKKELLGNFHRAGTTFTAETVETFDHDFGSAGEGKLMPHGVYDMVNQHAHLHLNASHDPASCVVTAWRCGGSKRAERRTPRRNGCWCLGTVAAATAPRSICSRKICKGWPIGWG
jgi:hypothetical protein